MTEVGEPKIEVSKVTLPSAVVSLQVQHGICLYGLSTISFCS